MIHAGKGQVEESRSSSLQYSVRERNGLREWFRQNGIKCIYGYGEIGTSLHGIVPRDEGHWQVMKEAGGWWVVCFEHDTERK